MDNVTIFWLTFFECLSSSALSLRGTFGRTLTKLSRNSALVALLWVHVPRYVGLTLLVTGMVNAKITGEFLFQCCLR